MALQHESTAPYRSVQRALRVLDLVSRGSSGASEAELARETGLSGARLTGLLRMLRREGYVGQGPDGIYLPGEALGRLGTARPPIQDTLDRLRASVGAALYVGRYLDGEVTVIHVNDGPETPAAREWVDFRSAGHATALGKSLLGQLDGDALRDHLSRHRPARLTSRTITDERVLTRRLGLQPASVPVLDLQEYAVGTVCAAVPVTAGAAVGCLGLSLPVEQVHRLRDAAEILNREAPAVLLSLTL
ncbi:IclR family transcriptional regulator [Streptomyces uncialis]|uniref:IclR family transcriptional regulator n=1 Tax=Streptomyces uncialis TaxID=1048205 RepID=A0A1Q4V041_9ACTN|nr:IclR family transcriptional regulator C-terminal domain-containing protein [Streptomyces uncialis]OKH91183.1 IclR family transcriptional regulator [Streptomyces uncialis]